MKFDLPPAFQQVLKKFEDRDTIILRLLDETGDLSDLHKALKQARKENVTYAQDELRALIPENLTLLDKQVEQFITGGAPIEESQK